MADQNEKLLQELLRQRGNNLCADCESKHVEWASYNIGIFLCTRCAGLHRAMGAHISKVKHLKLDKWEDSQLERMKEVGNLRAKLKYEYRVPPCYRRPCEDDPQVLVEQWIRSKYERLDFSQNGHPNYISGHMEGFLMKRGKEDSRYQPRKFILSETSGVLKYYVKESNDLKAVLRLSEMNVAFAPRKIDHHNSMQITYLKKRSTRHGSARNSISRHIYVYHDDPEVIHNWYMAIRCAKLHRLQEEFPSASEAELVGLLTRDFIKEGWLLKTGPRPSDIFKRRWFTLDNRKLMYHDEPLDAYPKGEIFLGHNLDGYDIRVGAPTQSKIGYRFTLFTPERVYYLSANSEQERNDWINVIKKVLERPPTQLDSSMSGR